MARARKDGDEYVSQNGYLHRRVNGKWIAVHRLVAEQRLGRPLAPNESAYFIDGDKSNFDDGNIGVRTKGGTKVQTRLAVVEDRIRELQAEREELLAQVDRIMKSQE